MRAIAHYVRNQFPYLPIIEALLLFQSVLLGHQIRFFGDPQTFPPFHGLLFAGAMMIGMTALGLYETDRHESFRQTAQRILIAYLLAMVLLSLVFFFFPSARPGRGVFAIATMLAIVSILLVRYIASGAQSRSSPHRKTLVIGDETDLARLQSFIQSRSARTSARIAGFFPMNTVSNANLSRLAADDDGLLLHVEQQNIREIVVASRDQRGSAIPMADLLELRLGGTRVLDLLSFFERELNLIRLDHLRYSWLVFGEGFKQSATRKFAKRVFDLSVSSLFLIMASPIMLLAAGAIFAESGGPIFYRQTRIGQRGKPFQVLKFRSMRTDAEKGATPQWATRDDPRVTSIGRFIRATRIDELPQLINVFSGEMSFVGPRPERPHFVDQFKESIPFYALRHRVKPGITGWAQIRLPYASSEAASREKLEYDLYYVKNNSLILDLIIMFETVQVVLRGKGI